MVLARGGEALLVEDVFWKTLTQLAHDRIVNVRIGVARLVGIICGEPPGSRPSSARARTDGGARNRPVLPRVGVDPGVRARPGGAARGGRGAGRARVRVRRMALAPGPAAPRGPGGHVLAAPTGKSDAVDRTAVTRPRPARAHPLPWLLVPSRGPGPRDGVFARCAPTCSPITEAWWSSAWAVWRSACPEDRRRRPCVGTKAYLSPAPAGRMRAPQPGRMAANMSSAVLGMGPVSSR